MEGGLVGERARDYQFKRSGPSGSVRFQGSIWRQTASIPSSVFPCLRGGHLRDERAPAHGEQPPLLRERELLAAPGA
jgi:hypothetical protein